MAKNLINKMATREELKRREGRDLKKMRRIRRRSKAKGRSEKDWQLRGAAKAAKKYQPWKKESYQ